MTDFLMVWPILLVRFFLRPIADVRFGNLYYDRIGHLMANTECWLRRRSMHPRPEVIDVLFSGPPANRQLVRMIRRRVRVWEGKLAIRVYRALQRVVSADADFWTDMIRFHSGKETFKLWDEGTPQLEFTEEERRRGRALLRSMGVPDGAPYVCIHDRDRSYLEKTQPYGFPAAGWSHHDYRDCRIENFLPAAEYLANLGYWVIRMGAVVERPMSAGNPKIIDYATKYRSDFGDIYIPATCRFFVGNTAGLFLVPTSFNIPVVWTNATPLGMPGFSARDIFIPKKYRRIQDGRPLTFSEIFEMGADMWAWSRDYELAGIQPIENTAEEILAAAREMQSRLDGTWTPPDGDEERQTRFRGYFRPGHRMHGYTSRVGAEFLKKNAELLK